MASLISSGYQFYDLTSSLVMNADMVFSASENATFFSYSKSHATNLHEKHALILLGGHNEAYGGVSLTGGKTFVHCNKKLLSSASS